MFSKSCQYALQAVLYIALHGQEGLAVKIKEISKTQNIPIHFLGKVLQVLVKHKILESLKGPTGGFVLSNENRKLTLLEIVKVIDGLDIFNQCGIGLKTCSDSQPCPIHSDYKIVKEKIKSLLDTKTIDELCHDVKEGKSIVSFMDS
jgi:Rrf2 family protein